MRALLSVYDKTGIEALAGSLVALGWEIVSTGGTLAAIEAAGIPVTSVSTITGFPEILDGRVKTLHPRIHGGLLARTDLPDHRAALVEHEIVPIELVVCNLYPFEATVRDPDLSLADAVEQIDIGGPAMVRAAAKNFAHVAVVVSPADYDDVLEGLNTGSLSPARRRELAAKAFAHVSAYDAVVAEYLRGPETKFPEGLTFAGRKVQDLRYGENPHQAAAAYRRIAAGPSVEGVLNGAQLHGKELSFNNLLDADAAWGALRFFDAPAVSIVKHMIPCGLAVHDDLATAFVRALAGDPVSAYGGIVGFNRMVDLAAVEAMADIFFEVVVAPGFTPEALERLRKRRNLRLLAVPSAANGREQWTIRAIEGGFLVQQPDREPGDRRTWQAATKRLPTADEEKDLAFAWQVCRSVKSNAIVLAYDQAVTGVGSGQPNRLESVRIAASKAGRRAAGSVLASDAYFPFADGLQAAAATGVTAVIQPGGSIRDDEVIAAADEAGIAMIFTGMRHFLH